MEKWKISWESYNLVLINNSNLKLMVANNCYANLYSFLPIYMYMYISNRRKLWKIKYANQHLYHRFLWTFCNLFKSRLAFSPQLTSWLKRSIRYRRFLWSSYEHTLAIIAWCHLFYKFWRNKVFPIDKWRTPFRRVKTCQKTCQSNLLH